MKNSGHVLGKTSSEEEYWSQFLQIVELLSCELWDNRKTVIWQEKLVQLKCFWNERMGKVTFPKVTAEQLGIWGIHSLSL